MTTATVGRIAQLSGNGHNFGSHELPAKGVTMPHRFHGHYIEELGETLSFLVRKNLLRDGIGNGTFEDQVTEMLSADGYYASDVRNVSYYRHGKTVNLGDCRKYSVPCNEKNLDRVLKKLGKISDLFGEDICFRVGGRAYRISPE
jgi:hypothetical protein